MTDADLMNYVPIGLMFLFAAGFVVVTMLATHWLGPNRKTKVKLESFECGIEPRGNARALHTVSIPWTDMQAVRLFRPHQ